MPLATISTNRDKEYSLEEEVEDDIEEIFDDNKENSESDIRSNLGSDLQSRQKHCPLTAAIYIQMLVISREGT